MFNVLLVEDEEIERIALKRIILDKLSNVEIIGEAHNGYEAIGMVKRKDVDLVLLDINMPGLNGLEVVKYIKGNYPETIVIIMTAYDTFEFAHSALKLKVDDFLLKPTRPSEIINTLEQYFDSINGNLGINMCCSFLKQLRNEILGQSYNNSIQVVRNFVFEVYENSDYSSNISKLIIEFCRGILNICEEINLKSVGNVMHSLRIIQNDHIRYYSSYDMFSRLSSSVDLIFNEIIDVNKSNGSAKNIKKILNYVDRNIKNGVSLEETADYANISIYYLSKIFKKEMNMNFVTYITRKKMEIAKDILINTDEPIVNIAIELSYNEANYFSKVFKSNIGITPTEFREKNKRIKNINKRNYSS